MRTLALLLALVLAPQAALARVAAFPETALRGDREISALRVGANASQLAETRQETACFYDSTASAMTDDPINHRDPTGQCVWETDPAKQKECWSKAGAALQRAKGANVDPHQCEAALRQILDGTYSGIPDETTADCIFATYSMKDGVTVTSAAEKEAGVDLDRDALHRRFVRLLAQYEIRTEAKYRRKSTQRLFAAAINRGAIRRTNLGLTESLLGRDVNRYFYGRMSQFYDQIQAVYEGAKKYLPDSVITRGSKHPASARGGRYFVEAGIRHSAACGYAPAVPIFEPTDAPMIPNYSTEDSLETEICVPEDQLFPDLPPLDMADIY